MQEKTYYTNGKVTVTSSRFILPDQTYAMSGITSVKLETIKPNRFFPILLMITGLSLGLYGLSIFSAVLPIVVGIIWFIFQKTKYTISISSASGQEKALTSVYGDFVRGVVEAINQAIVDRG